MRSWVSQQREHCFGIDEKKGVQRNVHKDKKLYPLNAFAYATAEDNCSEMRPGGRKTTSDTV